MKKKIIYISGFIIGLLVLGFAYYTISPLFINIKVDESISPSNTSTTTVMKSMDPVNVTGTKGHPASGTVRIVEVDGERYLRYENFKTINGPDIYVYLAKDLDAKDFVSLGKVKGTEGNINYLIPKEVDTNEYKYAVTWCKQFGVLFNWGDVGVSSSTL